VRSAVESTDEADIFERRLMDNAPPDMWLDADCRVALLGDGGRLFVSFADVFLRDSLRTCYQSSVRCLFTCHIGKRFP
jgi:hypothetical protein